MLLTITFSISALVIINLLLLKFSCNKTVKTTKMDKKPVILRSFTSTESGAEILAPTGS